MTDKSYLPLLSWLQGTYRATGMVLLHSWVARIWGKLAVGPHTLNSMKTCSWGLPCRSWRIRTGTDWEKLGWGCGSGTVHLHQSLWLPLQRRHSSVRSNYTLNAPVTTWSRAYVGIWLSSSPYMTNTHMPSPKYLGLLQGTFLLFLQK